VADNDQFPPVPDWAPSIPAPLERIVERFSYYTNDSKDFVVFANGTCVIVSPNLAHSEAVEEAKQTLHEIFHFHPDMKPLNMDDGNILVQYNHPAFSVVIEEELAPYLQTIKDNHQRALAKHEVLITSLGNNVFDEFGMKALFGRCYFFMDAKNPQVYRIIRGKKES
jgi:hypothetical protein